MKENIIPPLTKRRLILLTFSVVPATLLPQDLAQKIAFEICHCVDTIENMDSLESKIDRCSYDALISVLESSSDEVQEIYSSDELISETLNQAIQMLLPTCPKIRKYIISERKTIFYKRSDSEAANNYYEKGNKLFNEEDVRGAIKFYFKALKTDQEFIYAIDNIGLSYRKLGENKKAIKYFLKSLDIYPEGSYSLQNLGDTYLHLNQLWDAISCYEKLTFYYPEDPEGYLGIGRVFVTNEEYEKAIDFVFIAHKIYSARNSEYAKESENLALIIYNKLKEQNKLELFSQKAQEYGISLK